MANTDYGAAFEAVASQLSNYKETLRERDHALERVSALRVESASADGAVRVAVNSEGFLLSLQLAPIVRNLPADQIADLILQVYTSAQRSAASQATDLIQSVFGGIGGTVAEKYRWRLESEPPTADPRMASSDSDPEDDDDYDQASTFRA